MLPLATRESRQLTTPPEDDMQRQFEGSASEWCGLCASSATHRQEPFAPYSPQGLQAILIDAVAVAVRTRQVPADLHGELILEVTTTTDGVLSTVILREPPVPDSIRGLAEAAFSYVTQAPAARSVSAYVLRY